MFHGKGQIYAFCVFKQEFAQGSISIPAISNLNAVCLLHLYVASLSSTSLI